MPDETPAFKISIVAYLCNRDRLARNLAQPTLDQLQSLKRDYPELNILVALDDPGGSPWFAELTTDPGTRHTLAQDPAWSIKRLMESFLVWAQQRLPENATRIFLFSGHGTPGYGLGQYEIGPSDIMKLANTPEIKAYLKKQARPANPNEPPAENPQIAFTNELKQLVSSDLIPQLKDLEDDAMADALSKIAELLLRLGQRPRLLEVGVTLLSAGVSNDDNLSVRGFRHLIEKHLIFNYSQAIIFLAPPYSPTDERPPFGSLGRPPEFLQHTIINQVATIIAYRPTA